MANEKRLIDANVLLRKRYEVYEPEDPEQWGSRSYTHKVVSVEDVKKAPTVDAVEVVRCRDCVYWENGKDYTPFCNRPEYGFHECPKPDDFCSYGEKRDV